jgi:hypothetical protein
LEYWEETELVVLGDSAGVYGQADSDGEFGGLATALDLCIGHPGCYLLDQKEKAVNEDVQVVSCRHLWVWDEELVAT